MAIKSGNLTWTFPVSSGSAINEGEFVSLNTSGQVLRTATNAVVIGVAAENAAASAASLAVEIMGPVFKVVAGGTVAVGDVLYAGTTGRTTATANTGAVAKFVALEAGAAGQLISVVRTV
jgi:hypothetical protein